MTREIKKLQEKYLLRILIITFLIVLVSSMESLMLAKSTEFLDSFLKSNPGSSQGDYLNTIIMSFLASIFEPVIISIYTFATHKKLGIKKIYKFIFAAILGLRLFNTIISFRLNSVFYYILIILYILLIICVIKVPVNKRKV